MQNNIFVIDNNEILIFDSYGNSIGRASGNEEFTSIRIIFNWLTVTTKNRIYQANLNLSELNLEEVILNKFNEEFNIVSSVIFNNKLYILTKDRILVFNKI